MIICDPEFKVPVVRRIVFVHYAYGSCRVTYHTFSAQILVFDISVPIIQGTSVMFHHLQTIQPGTITKLISLLDKTTQAVSKAKPRTVTSNSLACVEIELMDPVCVELAKINKDLGRFALRAGEHTIAAGLITELVNIASSK